MSCKSFLTLLFFLFLPFVNSANAIPVYYTTDDVSPALMSTYTGMFNMKSIAEDLAELLTQATGKQFTASPYSGNKNGILLLLDSTFKHESNEAGTVEYSGDGLIIFKARYVTASPIQFIAGCRIWDSDSVCQGKNGQLSHS